MKILYLILNLSTIGLAASASIVTNIAFASPTASLTSTEETFNHFQAAVEISEREFKACDPMLKAHNSYKPSAADGRTFKDKAEALEVLSIIEKASYEFPGGDLATSMLLTKLEKLAQYPDQEKVLRLRGRLQTGCDLLFSMRHLKLLLKYEGKFFFTPEEKARIQTAARKFLLDKTLGTTLLSQGTHANVLREYLEYSYKGKDRQVLIEDTEELLSDYEKARAKLVPAFREFDKKYPNPTILHFKIENDFFQILDRKYKALIKRAFKERA